MRNIKSFDTFVNEGALGTAAASLGMRGKGSSSHRNSSKSKGDKNEWKKYVNPKRWFSDEKEEYCDACDRVKSECVCDKKEVNEELSPETYLSAADKLREKGHRKRSDKLREYVKELSKNIEPITIELYGKTLTMGADNIIMDDNDKWCIIEIWFDLSTNVEFDDTEPEDYDPWVMYLNYDKKGDFIDRDGMVTDRKTSVKLLKLLKNYAKTLTDKKVADAIMKLTVNDLYEE